MRYFILSIIVVPAAEIAILLTSGQIIGVWPTIFLIILTGVFGTYFAKKQGLATFYQLQRQLQSGQIPGESLLDGICILVGGTLLLTPGFITDIIGLLLLVPITRVFFKKIMKNWFKNRIRKGNIKIIN
ncbi:FxsA family protein [Bacillus sp. CGMCC 1.16607]|uniref:FxsA family protein n=1 Tax=Bacillus sp. CGMCC 1.16607 TaxID=3351842 RepID=UPI00362C3857